MNWKNFWYELRFNLPSIDDIAYWAISAFEAIGLLAGSVILGAAAVGSCLGIYWLIANVL